MAGLPAVADTFSALRYRQFGLLWAGLATSSLGGNMQQFALGWLLVQLAVREGAPERAAFYIGLVGGSRGLPGVAFGLLGGVFADRVNRRILLLITRLAGAAGAAALAGLVLADRVDILAILALNVVGAITDSMDLPARNSLTAQILPQRVLVSAYGLNASTTSAAGIFGPLLAGVLIGPIGIAGLMLVKTFAFVVAVIVLLCMEPVATPDSGGGSGVARSLADGFAYVMWEPVLRWLILLSMLASLVARPMNALLPAYVQTVLAAGPLELSWLLALTGVGGLAGSLLAATLGSLRRQGPVLVGSLLVWGGTLALFGLQQSLAPALLLVALPQVSWFVFATMAQVLCQVRSPDHLRGRAMSIYTVTLSGAMPLGALLLGSLGTLFGVGSAITIGGLVLGFAAVGAAVASPALRTVSVGEPGPVARKRGPGVGEGPRDQESAAQPRS